MSLINSSQSWSRPSRSFPRVFQLLAIAMALSYPVMSQQTSDLPYPAQMTAPASLSNASGQQITFEELVENLVPSRRSANFRANVRRQNNGKDGGESTGGKDQLPKGKSQTNQDEGAKSNDNFKDNGSKVITENLNSITSLTVSLDLSAATSTAPAADDSPLPVAFDTTLDSEFKNEGGDDSCPTFIGALLNSNTFRDCYPLSMMLQTSTSFFNARKQLTSTVKVLDATCAADVESCSNFFDTAAKNLTADANCKDEFDNKLRLVMEAYQGLMAYKMLFTASCLQDPESEMYCFANAVTNLSTPSDAYMYFLPYGLALPGSSTPSCNWCNKETMNIYHAASADRQQSISLTYEDAARQLNTLCDLNFVNGTLPEPGRSLGHVLMPSWTAMAATILFGTMLRSLLT